MQIKIFTIPINGGEKFEEEMNKFLRGNKILKIENQLINEGGMAYWSFCIKYMENTPGAKSGKTKVDYQEILDETSFQRFTKMRQIRRELAQQEGIPAYAIFTNEELASLAKIEKLTLVAMKKIKGIGLKKVEKYGKHFITINEDEKSK